MAKPTSKPRRTRRSGRPRRAPSPRPVGPFWSELLATLQDLRAEVKRLADTGGLAPATPERHLDWKRFTESRKAAEEDRERYWREVAPKAAAE